MGFPSDLGGTEAGPSGGEGDDLDSVDTGGAESDPGDDVGGVDATDDDDDFAGDDESVGRDIREESSVSVNDGAGGDGTQDGDADPPSSSDDLIRGPDVSGPPAPDMVPDPTAESSPGGENVTGDEAQEILEQSRGEGTEITNLDERPALADRIEGATGVDPRERAAELGGADAVDIGISDGEFTATREGTTQQGSGVSEAGLRELVSDTEAGDRLDSPSRAGIRELVGDTEAGDLRDTEARLAGTGLVGDTEREPSRRPGIAEMRARENVRENLREKGLDPSNFEVSVSRDGGEVRASAQRRTAYGEAVVSGEAGAGAGAPGLPGFEGRRPETVRSLEGVEPDAETTRSLLGGGGFFTGEGETGAPPGVALPVRLATDAVGVTESDVRGASEEFYDVTPIPSPTEIKTEDAGVLDIEEPNTPVGEEGTPERVLEGLTAPAAKAANIPRAALGVDQALETAENAPETVEEFGGGEVGETVGIVTRETAERRISRAKQNPARTTGGVAFEVAASGSGIALGRGVRALRSRARTAGAADIDAADLTGEDVLKANDPDIDADGQTFPPIRGSTDPTDQADVLERQAGEFTPEEVQNELGGEAPEGAADLKKALPVEPEGPDGGRGFKAPESDTAEAAAYETPGTSVGPELSPYFYGDAPEPRFSPIPGLPDFGGKPTAAIIRAELRETDATDVAEFRDELLAAEEVGDRAARTLPPDEVAPAEAELVIPPSATFTQVTDTGLFSRLGIGSDLAVEAPSGQRVPLRLFTDPDLEDVPGGAGAFDPDSGLDFDANAEGDIQRSIAEIERRRRAAATRPTDRPLPVLPGYEPTGNVSDVSAAESRADLVRRETAPPDEDREPETLEEFFDRRRRENEDGARSVTPDDLLGGATSSAAGDTTRGDQPIAVSRPLVNESTSPGGPSSSGGPTSGRGSSAPPSPPPSPPPSVPPSTPPPSGGSGGPPSTVPPSIPPTGPPVGGPPTPPPSLREGDDGDSRRERDDEALIPLEFQFNRAVGEVDQLVAGGEVEGSGPSIPDEDVPTFEVVGGLSDTDAFDDLVR